MIADSLLNKEFELEGMSRDEIKVLGTEILDMDFEKQVELMNFLWFKYAFECDIPAVKEAKKNLDKVHEFIYLLFHSEKLRKELKTKILVEVYKRIPN